MNINEYRLHPKTCKQCNVTIPYERRRNTYCSHRCGAIYSQRNGGNRIWDDESKKKQSEWSKIHNYRPRKNGITKQCLQCKNDFYVPRSLSKKQWCSKKCFQLWVTETDYMKGKAGGYRKEAGRGKMGWYKGYYCNSTWELAWVMYQLDRGINFKRNTKGFEYEFKGKQLKFYPDFILENGEYVEIKGWVTEKDKSKFSTFPKTLNILYQKDMAPIINAIISKYGPEYWKCYEPKILGGV